MQLQSQSQSQSQSQLQLQLQLHLRRRRILLLPPLSMLPQPAGLLKDVPIGIAQYLPKGAQEAFPLRLHVPVNDGAFDDASAASGQRTSLWARLSGWTTSLTPRSTSVESIGIPLCLYAVKRDGMALVMAFLAGWSSP